MTTTKHRFANNFALGGIGGLFEEIQMIYEAVLAMNPAGADRGSFNDAVAEIDRLYSEVDDAIANDRDCAREALRAQRERLFPSESADQAA